MGVIRLLSDEVANKIAAGEVIERPASVVKELLENALDAGARSIRLEVEGGGRARIRMTDDGCGMVRDDALLSLERHATSKLRSASDLDAISTLGFRGEAMPSIASVSQLTLETAAASGGAGTRITVYGGRIKQVEEAGLPPGTDITVANLFFNVPARRKFLKSEGTELGHIVTLVTHYALAYPEMQFHLETPHRALLSLTPVAGYAERIRQIFGDEMLDQLVEFRDLAQWPAYRDEKSGEVEDEAAESIAGLGMFGFASRPELQKLNRNSIFVFVNRRLVRDRLLQHAITQAYFNLLPSGAYPAVLLFLDLPFSEVDVNVHPSKVEVRFRRQGFVHDAVRDSIRQALGSARPIPSFLRERDAHPTARVELAAPPARTESSGAGAAADATGFAPRPIQPAPWQRAVAPGGLGISVEDLSPGFNLTPLPLPPRPQKLPLSGEEMEIRPDDKVMGRDFLSHLKPLGQIQESFIVAASADGMALVDQHVAHERVLFEQVLQQRRAGKVERQGLLMPMVLDLDPGRFLCFSEIAPELEAMGFDADVFGQRSVAVRSAPAGIRGDQVEKLLQTLLELAQAEEGGISLDQLRARMAATIACHAAIKVNMHLEREKMEWLLRALARTEHPMTCPHGRPVVLRYSLDEIRRAFKRL